MSRRGRRRVLRTVCYAHRAPPAKERRHTTMTRTNSTTATIAVAADYADAMMTARRAKNWLFMLLLLVLLTQLTIFFLLRFRVIRMEGDVSVTVPTAVNVDATTQPEGTTQPAEGSTQPAAAADVDVDTKTKAFNVSDILRYVIPVTDFLGITLLVVLAVVLLLIVTIMLVGRLIGVSHVTSAFVWCVLLAVMVFPWQAFLLGTYRPAQPGRDGSPGIADARGQSDPTFKIPGALYTWEELRRDYSFENLSTSQSVLKWARFAGFPILALLLLLMVQAKSSRGLKYALGESEVQVEVTGGDRLT